jgi:TRAP-type C4-dicarboxylate transport system permease small subunit
MTRLHRFARYYVRTIETIGILSIAGVAIVAVLQVYFRYVVGASLYWSEELMRHLTIWMAFLLAGLAYTRGEMMGFTLVRDMLPARLRYAVRLVVRVIVVLFLLITAWYGFDFARRTATDMAVAMQVPMLWFHLSVPVGCLLMAIHVAISQFIPETDITDNPDDAAMRDQI